MKIQLQIYNILFLILYLSNIFIWGEHMKKLVLTYVSVILAIVLVSIIFSFNKNKDTKQSYTLNIPEKINVYFKEEDKTYEVDFEEYLVNVVCAEVPASFHEEAVKAQAVAARTYIYNKYLRFTENPSLAPDEHKNAAVCTDYTHCCAYKSNEELRKIHGDEWMDEYYEKMSGCVQETRGEIILYEGEPITASFHASSGGCRTENSGDVWSSNLPYLASVESPDEDKREGYNSTVSVTCDEFKDIITAEFPDSDLGDDRNLWIGDIEYTAGNSVNIIRIGNKDIRGTKMRSLFGLKSACFEIKLLNDNVIFNVHGSGHGVGMSQHGANIMANKGVNYIDILKWYYTGVEIKK